MAESMLGEFSDASRVLFIPDYNTAALITQKLYQTQGRIWTLIVSKYETAPDLFTLKEASRLLEQGAMRLAWAGYKPLEQRIILTAVGSYQLEEALKASFRLSRRKVPHSVVYMLEPGKFRYPRSAGEAGYVVRKS